MASVAQALRAHTPEYLQGLSDSAAHVTVRKVFAALMRCRTGELGGVRWQCGGCGHTHWAGRSCGNRHCATCGSDKTTRWLDKDRKDFNSRLSLRESSVFIELSRSERRH